MEHRKWRMYGLVPYNISPIQQGIQFGHAVVEYGLYANEAQGNTLKDYLDWANNDKVFIILNGGTTNKAPIVQSVNDFKGSLNNHLARLEENGLPLSTFYEEDLGDQLTAVTFLVDERVWDTDTYLDFDYALHHDPEMKLTDMKFRKERYIRWLNEIGGKQNEFLREFLKQFELA